MARAVTDHRRGRTLGMGLAERTGLVISGSTARAIGRQSVWFVEAREGPTVWRQPGRPLAYGQCPCIKLMILIETGSGVDLRGTRSGQE